MKFINNTVRDENLNPRVPVCLRKVAKEKVDTGISFAEQFGIVFLLLEVVVPYH